MVQITLVSNDEQSFQVERDILKQSGTIENLIVNMNLDDEDTDASVMPIPLPNVKGTTLKTVVQWMEHHKADHVKEEEDEENNTEIVVPDWDKSILDPINKTSVLLELTVAANYLDIKALLNYTCKTIANSFKGKTGEQIRDEWGVPNEFTPEEEAAIKKENEWCE